MWMGIIELLVWKIMWLKINPRSPRTSPLWPGTKLSAVIQILLIIHVSIHNLERNRNKDMNFVHNNVVQCNSVMLKFWNNRVSKWSYFKIQIMALQADLYTSRTYPWKINIMHTCQLFYVLTPFATTNIHGQEIRISWSIPVWVYM